jgi:hypothetical protein
MIATDFLHEEKFTTNELAEKVKLHPSMIRKLFLDEVGVVRVGHGPGSKRQYFKLLIPESVAQRVFGRMTVGGGR